MKGTKMMKKIIALISCITMGISADGKIGGVTYFEYFNAKDKSAFNFNRQYFSYTNVLSDIIKFKIVFDVGRTNIGSVLIEKNNLYKSEDTRLVVFLKKAQIDYKTSYGKISMGLIGMNTYGVHEKNWGYRFIEKSAIDKYGFSSTTDLGVGFSRSLIDNLNISLQVVNGEGYKMYQVDKYHKTSFNATYGESKLNKNDGYNAGVVYSTESTDSDPTNMISVFSGFSGLGIRIGAEYDMLTKGDEQFKIISVSVNYGVMDNLDTYVRYDMWDNNDSVNKNGKNYLIAGVLLNWGEGLSVAPNIRIITYEDSAEAVSNEYRVNFQFKF